MVWGAGDLSSKLSKPLWQSTDQKVVLFKRTSGNDTQIVPFPVVSKPGSATFAEKIEVNSFP